MKRILWFIVLTLTLLAASAGEAQKTSRFQWMSQDRVQDNTDITVYIDRQTAECYAVWQMNHNAHSRAMGSAAFLGKVPCAGVKVQ